jgi:hypothetical protein
VSKARYWRLFWGWFSPPSSHDANGTGSSIF